MNKAVRALPEQFGAENSRATAAQVGSRELTISMNPMDLGLATYVGTRAQLEAEDIIPSDTVWPCGFDVLCWSGGQIQFRLHRQRPQGAKGPRRASLDIDNWCLMIEPKERDWAAMAIERKAKEIHEILYQRTRAGELENSAKWERIYAARNDEKFQAFKALIPGLIPPPRKPRGRRRTASTYLQAAQGGDSAFSTTGGAHD